MTPHPKRWALSIGIATFIVAGCASFGTSPAGARLERMRASPLYKGDHFENPEHTEMMPGGNMWRVAREFIFGNGQMREPTCTLPLFGDVTARVDETPESGLRITWLGHSTTLIEIDGKRVLTDPMWSERASPFTWAGPKRFHPPPLPLERLPHLDAVVISHDHYDHLDMETVRALAKRGVMFHVALGVGAHLEGWGVAPAQIREHAWWEAFDLGDGVQIVSAPARHFSGRGLTGRDATLWTGWVLAGPRHRVFFSGDTGLTEDFKETASRWGPFDVAMLEIGQWHESWGQIHLGPRGALQALEALGNPKLLPIHWATFELGLHAWSEPAETIVTLAEPHGLDVLTPLLGQPIEPTQAVLTPRWWRTLPPLADACPPDSSSTKKSLNDWAM